MMFKIGMRNIKTGIAVFLCIVISRLLKLEYPFYTAIAAVISMESSLTNSLRIGKNRMKGTFIGALTGLTFSSIMPGSALLSGIGVIIVIYLCNLFKWKKSASIACVVFIAIMVNLNGRSPLQYSINRLIDTFIGIMIALLVNYLIYPHIRIDSIIKRYDALLQKIFSTIGQMICQGNKVELKDLNSDIKGLMEQFDIYNAESRVRKDRNDNVEFIKKGLDFFNDIYTFLKTIQRLEGSRNLNTDNIEKIRRIYNCSIKAGGNSNDDADIVYNYLVGKIIEDLEGLKLFDRTY